MISSKDGNLKSTLFDSSEEVEVFWCWVGIGTVKTEGDSGHLTQKRYVGSNCKKGKDENSFECENILGKTACSKF